MASNPKMEYQVFLCIFQKNSAMVTYGLKEMGKFLREGREKSKFAQLNVPFYKATALNLCSKIKFSFNFEGHQQST